MKSLYFGVALLAAQCASSPDANQFNQQVIGSATRKDAFEMIKHKLTQAAIIPEVVDDFVPKCFVNLLYDDEKKPVALGNKIKISKTKTQPALRITCPDMISTTGLTLALTDPDAPSRDKPKWGEMCHWIAIVSAVRPTVALPEFEIESSAALEEIIEYKPPGPPAKTGYHRYVFVLLEGINTNLTAPEDRQHWGTGEKGHGVRDWARNESLQVVGANWFIEKNKKQ